MVGLSGFEPLTSRLSAVRSSQLSYRPVDATLSCCTTLLRSAGFTALLHGLRLSVSAVSTRVGSQRALPGPKAERVAL
jgi:hypothetical protein